MERSLHDCPAAHAVPLVGSAAAEVENSRGLSVLHLRLQDNTITTTTTTTNTLYRNRRTYTATAATSRQGNGRRRNGNPVGSVGSRFAK
jgi:hypothetical protein